MLDGHGHNNPDYLPKLGFFNALGGVCNGITAGFEDEADIAFNPPVIKTTCYKIGAGVSSGSPMQAGYFSLWHCGRNTIKLRVKYG
ncbi:glucosamine-link cellobiase [Vibrio maritimus]|uniref:Glucosamine-link cellobiase n=1 Tax=Vibrio maritimus TaxID=990268 RepID=A0A090RY29_9VIBR|nr:glucosamine-link cellobiase [Vibrio maritimus]